MVFTYSVLPTADTFIDFHSLFYTAFPIPGIRKNVCAALRPALQVRKAAPEQRQPVSCRFMPELQRQLKQHGIPLYEASCRSSWANGDTFRFVPSVVSPDAARRKESPLCLPGRPLFVPPGRCHFYRFHPHRFYSGNTANPFLSVLLPLVFAIRAVTARGFVRCECRLPRLFPPF